MSVSGGSLSGKSGKSGKSGRASPNSASRMHAANGGSSRVSRRGSGGSGVSRKQYQKSYSSYRDESIAGETVISLGSIDELREGLVSDELIKAVALERMSTDEKCHLDNTMQRYHSIEEEENLRKAHLRQELHALLAQVNEVQSSDAKPGLLQSSCELCGARLMFYNRRYVCQRCEYLACQNCVRLIRGGIPQCRLCHLESLTEAKSGEWFLTLVRRKEEQALFGTDILRASLRQERGRMVREEKARREKSAEASATLEPPPPPPPQASTPPSMSGASEAGKKSKKDKKGKRDKKDDGAAASVASATSKRSGESKAQSVAVSSKPPMSQRPSVTVSLPVDSVDAHSGGGEYNELEEQQHQDEEEEEEEEGGDIPPLGGAGSQSGIRKSNLLAVDTVSTEEQSDGDEADLSMRAVLESASALQEFLVGYAQRRVSISCPDLSNFEPTAAGRRGRRLSIPALFGAGRNEEEDAESPEAPEPAGPRPGDRRVSIPCLRLEASAPQVGERVSPSCPAAVGRRLLGVGLAGCDLVVEEEEEEAAAAQRQTGPSSASLELPRCTSRESMMSNVSENEDAFNRVKAAGDVEVALAFDYRANKFSVKVVQCRNLASVSGKPPNPYVKTYLLPDKTKRSKRRTEVKRATANPIFGQWLTYEISKSELEMRSLYVAVWHRVTFGSNIFLGESRVPMDDYRFVGNNSEVLALEEHREVPVPLPTLLYRGDILLSLRYLSQSVLRVNQLGEGASAKGRLEVWVQSCKNLTGSGSDASPFVKGYLLPDKKRTKQKSAIVKGDVNPNFNSILAFDKVSLQELKERSLELSVWDYSRLGSHDFLGGVRLNLGLNVEHNWMDSRGQEQMMWSAMLEKPNTWIEGSLLLRPHMDPLKGGHS